MWYVERASSADMRSALRTNFEREDTGLGSVLTIKATHLETLQGFIIAELEAKAQDKVDGLTET
jgi:hypothetical protein